MFRQSLRIIHGNGSPLHLHATLLHLKPLPGMPRRWTDLDSDEHRLPEGFRRTGYDADERRHYFRDGDGRMWRGEPGNEYGILTPVRPEPPVTIPRRQPRSQPPPPYSKESVDDPSPDESTSRSKYFTDILSSHKIASASSSTPKRSHTISIPTVASLKRSSTTVASFIKSRGKYFSRSGHSKESSYDDNQRSRPAISPVTVRRSATTTASSTAAYMRGMMRPSVEPMDGDPQSPTRVADRKRGVVRFKSTTTGSGEK